MARRRAQSPPHNEPSATRRRAHPSAPPFDSDAAQTESQQILAVPPLLRKPKKEDSEMQQFRARVVEDQEGLRALIKGGMGRIKEAGLQRRNNLTTALRSALQTPSRHIDGPAVTFPGTSIAENVGFATAAVVLNASDALASEYSRVNEGITNMAKETEGRDTVADDWRKEVRDFERILRAGARKAERDIAKTLGSVSVEQDGTDEDEDTEPNSVQVMRGRDVSDELKNSVAYMERGVRRMVKALPRGEDE